MANLNKIRYAPELHISIFAFLLNFIWELLQLPLFIVADDFPYYEAIMHCTIATFGDVIISLAAFTGACLATRSRAWITTTSKTGVITFLTIGLIITIIFELLATGPLDMWQYGESMPVIPILGVGISPIIQWIILPLIQLWFVRHILLAGEYVVKGL